MIDQLNPAISGLSLQKTNIMNTKDLLNGFKEMAEKAVGTIKEEVDDFKHKWAPDAEIVSGRFEELKTEFRKALDQMELNLNSWLNEHPEELHKIRQTIDETRLQLALGKAETLEKFEEQQKMIIAKWNLLKMKLESQPQYLKVKDEVGKELNDWRVRLDILKIQYSLGRMEWRDNWKNISSELGREVDNLGKALEAGVGIAGEKLEKAEEEIQRIFNK